MKWPSKRLQNLPLSTQGLGENTNIWYLNIPKISEEWTYKVIVFAIWHTEICYVSTRRCIFCNLCNLVKIKFCDNLSSPTSDTPIVDPFSLINGNLMRVQTTKKILGSFCFLHTVSNIVYYYTSLIMVIVLDSSVSPILVSTKNT